MTGLDSNNQKRCSTCKEYFPPTPEYFYRNSSMGDGITCVCKKCSMRNYVPHPTVRDNDFKTCPRCKHKYPRTSEFFYTYGKYRDGITTYCKKCTEEMNKEWRDKNKDAVRKIKNNYKKRNKRGVQDGENIRRQSKYKNDINFKISCNIRNRVIRVLKGKRKYQKTMDLIGCSIDELRRHIESLWDVGMSWDNHSYDGWHLDHIRPCASFDLSDPEQQKQCFSYKNLQPLWKNENQDKSSEHEGYIYWDGKIKKEVA